MFLSLGMRQVASLIVVKRETQFALVTSQVIFHKVRIFGQINRFQSQLTQTFTSISVALGPARLSARAGLTSSSVLEIHFGDFLQNVYEKLLFSMIYARRDGEFDVYLRMGWLLKSQSSYWVILSTDSSGKQ